MLPLLLLGLLPQLLAARDVPKDTGFVVHMTCPDVGYVFRRAPAPNSVGPPPCQLCFCRDDGTAICWKREDRRCDAETYQHKIRKRVFRKRRSPIRSSDVFLRDIRDGVRKNHVMVSREKQSVNVNYPATTEYLSGVETTDNPLLIGNETFNDVTDKSDFLEYSVNTHETDESTTLPTQFYESNIKCDKDSNAIECLRVNEDNITNTINDDFEVKALEDNLIITDRLYPTSFKTEVPDILILPNSSAYTPNSINMTDKNEIQQNHGTTKTEVKTFNRITSPQFKKYSTNKHINNMNNEITAIRNYTSLSERFSNDIKYIQRILKDYLADLRNRRKIQLKPIRKRYSLIRYIRKFFRNMFREVKDRYSNKREKQNQRILDKICTIFGNCDSSKRSNSCLNAKIDELNTESQNIIEIIRIIKDKLHLSDIPEKHNISKYESKLKNDINKLSLILRDDYYNFSQSFTMAQMNQIYCIRNNTKIFIQSVANFAHILSTIIRILTSKNISDYNCKIRTYQTKYNVINSSKFNDTITSCFQNIDNFHRNTQEKPKKVLKYEQTSATSFNVTVRNEKVNKRMNITLEKENEASNTSEAIESLSKNILKNLIELKNLAQSMSIQTRRKRSTLRDSDALEYLLTLVKYLLRQNKPLDVAPVSDGIDLLIDAIRSAPDIKLTRKKLLERTLTKMLPHSPKISEDQAVSSDSETISKERDNRLDLNDVEDLTVNKNQHEGEHDSDQEFYDTETKKDFHNVYNKANTNDNNYVITTSLSGLIKDAANTLHSEIDYVREARNYKNHPPIIEQNRVESDDSDNDENASASSTTAINTKAESKMYAEIPHEDTTKYVLAEEEVDQNNYEAEKNANRYFTVLIDWKEANEEKDKERKHIGFSTPPTSIEYTMPIIKDYTTPAPSTATTTSLKSNSDISNLSKEVMNDRRLLETDTHELLHQKQMNLINSLDSTEEIESEDSDSKNDVYDPFPDTFS